MSTTSDCPPFDACGPCGTLTGGFVRLRYFFGKRMGVTDFVDEQRYHTGKHAFHNQRAHGAGVLCGLAVTRQAPTEAVVRVGRGAAIDACGREIVVAYDQCIDLAAWFAREREARRASAPTWPDDVDDAAGNLPLVVLVRYRDCAVAPEPAPRDPCACDAAGCDFGRVREEFELDLATVDDPRLPGVPALTPAAATLERIVGRAAGGAAIATGLRDALTAGCAEPGTDGWLALGAFTAIVTGTGASRAVTDLGPIENRATILAETAVLQDLLLRQLGATLEAGALSSGPEVARVGVSADGARLLLDLSGPVVAATVPTGAFTLSRFDAAAASPWSSVAASTAYVAATTTAPARLEITVTGGVVDGARYRLALDPAEVTAAAPICDDRMRPLRPLRGVFQFAIALSGADFVVVDPPYVS